MNFVTSVSLSGVCRPGGPSTKNKVLDRKKDFRLGGTGNVPKDTPADETMPRLRAGAPRPHEGQTHTGVAPTPPPTTGGKQGKGGFPFAPQATGWPAASSGRPGRGELEGWGGEGVRAYYWGREHHYCAACVCEAH